MDLRDQLQRSLGVTYTLGRELGGGGMSRVFVARDDSLEREVVIKVLLPDLAHGLSAERFTREIKVLASLQEPHIVPLLAAGMTREQLPYYTMPFVRGESLRERIASAPLVLDDALSILRDVATALEYAHGHGVVHRDIKPENVLLSGRTAVVTDFGIAKALAEARAPGTGALTQAGMTLGSPAYMAPEQVSGDDVDHRADVYAWGVIAYELLAGRHPFAGKTSAQQLMAAHIAETAEPLESVAPGTPAAIAALVMRTLAKDPAARPASAGDLVRALALTSSSELRHVAGRGGRWARLAGAATGMLVVLALGGWLLTPASMRAMIRTLVTRAPPTFVVNRVVVAPFKDETGDPRLAVLGPLIADYLSAGLSRLGSLQVVDARTAAINGEIVRQIPRAFRSSDERALGEETGAKVVVAGSYYRFGDSVRFHARIVDAETGGIRLSLDPVLGLATAPERGVATLSARVIAALRAASDEDLAALKVSPPPSLAAFAAFRQAVEAFLRFEAESKVLPPLRRAMALDSTWAAPVVTLAFFTVEMFESALGDSALTHARRLQDRLTDEEAAYLDITEAVAQGNGQAALDAARRVHNPIVLTSYALAANRPRLAIAALRSSDPDRGMNVPLANIYWGRLAVAHAQIGQWDRALEALREGERRAPGLQAVGLEVEIAAERGDVVGVKQQLDARWRAGEQPLRLAADATTLLRTLGGHDAEGKALAAEWAGRLAAPSNIDSLAAHSTNAHGLIALLAAAERWAEVLRALDGGPARFVQDTEMVRFAPFALGLEQAYRAAALIHVGRRAEALAIDSVFARSEGARWDRGASLWVRAVVAAHLGHADRALALLTRSLAAGAYSPNLNTYGLGVHHQPLFLPLRDDPRFRELSRPDPADGR